MKKIIINKHAWQTRIAILDNEKLLNIYFSAPTQEPLERSFFKGRVTKVLPGIQTAFVDIGKERAGFLHISEIDREMAVARMSDALLDDDEQPKKVKREHIDIAKILHEGDPILVQVSKEPVYEKGAKLSTCFTLPGRFLVLMPNIARIGVSKKIESNEERWRLKNLVRAHLPEGMGGIIRTTSENRTDREIIEDITYLLKTWAAIEKAYKTAEVADRIHQDIPLPLQIIRDHLDDDVDRIIVDDKGLQKEIYQFIKSSAPEYSDKVAIYSESIPIFERYDIEDQIDAALRKKVRLKSGGSLIIESTEAMTVVDVNTGKFIGKGSMEETIVKTNIEAAEEIVRQLRLRNIGGLIVIDFIDMAMPHNRQRVFNTFEKELKAKDKFQSVVLKISEFGLVQMTRKRSGKTLVLQLTDECRHCKGLGFVKSIQVESYSVLQTLEQELVSARIKECTVQINPQIFDYLMHTEYNAILELEKSSGCKITLQRDAEMAMPLFKIVKK
jgi:ribonuclease G